MNKIKNYTDEQLIEEYKKQLMDEYNNPDKFDEPGDMPSYYLEEEIEERGLNMEVDVKATYTITVTWSK